MIDGRMYAAYKEETGKSTLASDGLKQGGEVVRAVADKIDETAANMDKVIADAVDKMIDMFNIASDKVEEFRISVMATLGTVMDNMPSLRTGVGILFLFALALYFQSCNCNKEGENIDISKIPAQFQDYDSVVSGMSEEELNRYFDEFVTKATNLYPGLELDTGYMMNRKEKEIVVKSYLGFGEFGGDTSAITTAIIGGDGVFGNSVEDSSVVASFADFINNLDFQDPDFVERFVQPYSDLSMEYFGYKSTEEREKLKETWDEYARQIDSLGVEIQKMLDQNGLTMDDISDENMQKMLNELAVVNSDIEALKIVQKFMNMQ